MKAHIDVKALLDLQDFVAWMRLNEHNRNGAKLEELALNLFIHDPLGYKVG